MPRCDPVRRWGSRAGLTRLEVVVLVAGVLLLVVFAVVQLGARRERGRLAAMEESLRRLAVAQESFAYDRGGYTGNLGALRERGLEMDAAVAITVHEATRRGWSASATHDATARGCYVFTGEAAPIGAATTAGTIACD
ncbi:MAG: hypothetical protein PVF27_03005 [Gemmatimonadales bacterium]|jgi:hypothetical protein